MITRRDVLRLTVGTAATMSVVSACTPLSKVTQDIPAAKNTGAAGHKTIATRLTKGLGVQHPVVCAGMAFVCDKADMCIAVINAGGIGALSGSLLAPPVLASQIAEVKAASDGAFHVGFLSIFPYEAQLKVCIEQQVPIVSFHYGVPDAATVKRLHTADISVWVQVGSVDDAIKAHEAGADGIIAQGHEAGGHTYAGMPIMALLPAIRDVVGDKLVFAAGGIADGRTAAASLAAGADGVWVGTLLVATTEANAHSEYKKRLVEAKGEDTVITDVYGPEMPAFNPMRIINNSTVKAWQNRVDERYSPTT